MTNKQKQHLLSYLGYYTGEIDGELSKNFGESTRRFQAEYGGLEVDGICGSKTEKAMKHAVAYGIPTKNVSDDFWDDIKYFERAEFKCKCGGKHCNGYPVEMSEKLVRIADNVRDHFEKSAMVSSGIRCEKHNANVGGVPNSRHLYGKAMDFCIVGHRAAEVLAYVQAQPEINYAYAIDSNYVHMDVE